MSLAIFPFRLPKTCKLPIGGSAISQWTPVAFAMTDGPFSRTPGLMQGLAVVAAVVAALAVMVVAYHWPSWTFGFNLGVAALSAGGAVYYGLVLWRHRKSEMPVASPR